MNQISEKISDVIKLENFYTLNDPEKEEVEAILKANGKYFEICKP